VKIQGSQILPASPQQVWDFLDDPTKLAKILPGCERLDPIGPDKYKVAVKFAIAAIGGSFQGTVELRDKKPPKSLGVMMESKGPPGFVRGEGAVQLTAKGKQTELKYSGEAQVGGMIAAVGQRMLDAAARRVIEQIFTMMASELAKAGSE